MTLVSAFRELNERLGALAQGLDNLLWAVVQGQPETTSGHALADRHDAVTNDLIGLVKEAQSAAQTGYKALLGPINVRIARRSLLICQERHNTFLVYFHSELLGLEGIDALNDMAYEQDDEWFQWVQGVRDALSPCISLFNSVSRALLSCWRDLTEHLSGAALAQMSLTGVPWFMTQPTTESQKPSRGPKTTANNVDSHTIDNRSRSQRATETEVDNDTDTDRTCSH